MLKVLIAKSFKRQLSVFVCNFFEVFSSLTEISQRIFRVALLFICQGTFFVFRCWCFTRNSFILSCVFLFVNNFFCFFIKTFLFLCSTESRWNFIVSFPIYLVNYQIWQPTSAIIQLTLLKMSEKKESQSLKILFSRTYLTMFLGKGLRKRRKRDLNPRAA